MILIVAVTTVDPIASGLIDSFARPGSNVTGITFLTRELNGKRLELLKEVVRTIAPRGRPVWGLCKRGHSFSRVRKRGAGSKNIGSIPRDTKSEPGFQRRTPSCDQGACKRAYRHTEFSSQSLTKEIADFV